MFSNIVCIALAVLSYAPMVYAISASHSNSLDTNAKRFARGLPPLHPSMMKRAVKRTGTKVTAAKRYQPSNVPTHTYTGKIIASRSDNGLFLGYINMFGSGLYTLTNERFAITVSFTAAATGTSTQLEIKDVTNNGATTPFFGGVEQSNNNLGHANANFVNLAGTAHTAEGVPPQTGASTSLVSGKVESSFWNFDSVTNRFTAQWINYDSTAPATSIVWDVSLDKLVLTGNPTTYLTTHPNSIIVTLSLI